MVFIGYSNKNKIVLCISNGKFHIQNTLFECESTAGKRDTVVFTTYARSTVNPKLRFCMKNINYCVFLTVGALASSVSHQHAFELLFMVQSNRCYSFHFLSKYVNLNVV